MPKKSKGCSKINAPKGVKNTKHNKIRRIRLALITAGGKAIDDLKERLALWEKK